MTAVDVDTRSHPAERIRPDVGRLLAGIWRTARRHPIAGTAVLLLLGDAAFTAIQVAVDITDYGFNGAYRLALETELGGGQIFGYLQSAAAAVLMVIAWRRYRSPAAGYWAAALGYLTIDDTIQIHEKLGRFLVERLDLSGGPFGRPQDMGEVVAYLLIAATALGFLIAAEMRDRGPRPTVLTQAMIPAGVLFLFFAVVIDVFGFSLPIAFEDGGELFALTGVLVTTAVWTLRPDELAAELSG